MIVNATAPMSMPLTKSRFPGAASITMPTRPTTATTIMAMPYPPAGVPGSATTRYVWAGIPHAVATPGRPSVGQNGVARLLVAASCAVVRFCCGHDDGLGCHRRYRRLVNVAA
jgi:hypothetical protein